MKTYNFELSNNSLENSIDMEYFKNFDNILIQIFSGRSIEELKLTLKEIKLLFPNSVTIGSTTDGEIVGQVISTKTTIISISVFESTTLKASYVNGDDCFNNGKELAKNLITSNTKLLITFTDGTTTNGEEFLKGIQSVNSDVIVSGGMAGDNGAFSQTYICCGDKILSKGAVGVSLSSHTLTVSNGYSFNWNPIGVGHTIDKVKNNRVYSIDGMSPVEFYAKYLGQYVAHSLPATGIEFPLIIEKNNIKIARAVITKHDDGSLSFAGNLKEGDRVRLGFGNAQTIINDPHTTLEPFLDIDVESFFLYSCMARRRYMPDIIQVEIEPFAKVAPVAGFFTYGEFYHNHRKNELLNQTLTVVALSESKKKQNNIQNKSYPILPKKHGEYATTIQALTNLIEQSTKDLEKQAKNLEKEKQFSQELLDKQKLFMRYAVHETITPLSVIMNNIELYELEYDKNIYLSNIEASMKNIFTIYDDLSYFVKKNQIKYPKHTIDLVGYIRSRVVFFTQVADQTNLTFHFETNIDKIIINFNETKLQRIVDNNITNALKYTLENNQIKIKIDKEDTNYTVSIESKSTHIQQKDKVFEAYYREKGSQDGFGLGLNLVKQICDEEDIDIVLSSNEKSTCFSYIFKLED